MKTENSLWKTLAQAITGRQTCLSGFDDTEIRHQSSAHGVDHLLTAQIKTGTVTGIGDALKTEFNSTIYPHVAYDMILNSATTNILDLMAANKIPALLLKGTPIAHLYYPNSFLRPRCDTDIYFDESQLDKLAELLSNHEYELSGLGTRK